MCCWPAAVASSLPRTSVNPVSTRLRKSVMSSRKALKLARGGLTEVADLAADLVHITIGPARQDPGGGRVLRTALHLLGQFVDASFQRGQTRFQAAGGLTHDE
jgi:hypothetical protein